MKKLAWYPENLAAPPELTAVRVKQGKIQDLDWENALADRIVEMVMKESDPQKAANEACLKMALANVDNPNQLGQVLLKDNLNLITNLNVLAIEDPFPAMVEESNPEAEKAIEETDLSYWVDLALSVAHESSLD